MTLKNYLYYLFAHSSSWRTVWRRFSFYPTVVKGILCHFFPHTPKVFYCAQSPGPVSWMVKVHLKYNCTRCGILVKETNETMQELEWIAKQRTL